MFVRGSIVVLTVLAAALPATAQTVFPGREWQRSTFEQQKMTAQPINDVVQRARDGGFGNIDEIVVTRNGMLLLAEKFDRDYAVISRGKKSPIGCGSDSCTPAEEADPFNYFHPRWHPYYQGQPVHTLQSVTKSVTASLIGIAIGQGKISGVNAPLLSFFSDYDVSKVDEPVKKATLADLLTMRTGIEWHENDRPLDETNTTLQLEKSKDWIRFTLSQPSDAEPGTKWVYNSGTSALMAEIIRKTTGMQADAYARQFLFTAIGITNFHWKKTPTGHPDTEGGLYLAASDLARVGWLYLNDGVWKGKRILPAGWAREATQRHVDRVNAGGAGYGYQWWRMDRRGVEVWAGNGFGGQFLLALPQYNVVAVVNSWNVFGTPSPGIVGPLLDALITSVGVPAS